MDHTWNGMHRQKRQTDGQKNRKIDMVIPLEPWISSIRMHQSLWDINIKIENKILAVAVVSKTCSR